jgi:hypothetical protein
MARTQSRCFVTIEEALLVRELVQGLRWKVKKSVKWEGSGV